MNSRATLVPIRTRQQTVCPLCGTMGTMLHSDVTDHVFGVAGQWNTRRCENTKCATLWLDPVPVDEDLPRTYVDYYTHLPTPIRAAGPLAAFVGLIKRGYLALRFGYEPPYAGGWIQLLGALLCLFPGRRESLDLSLMLLPASARGRVLDVGCGSGQTLLLLRELGWKVEGVDLDETAVQAARLRGLDVRVGTLESLHYKEGSFEAVTMSHVLEHVADPAGLFRQAHHVLTPGGRLVVTTPNANSLGHRRFGAGWRGLEPPRHFQIFTRASLWELAKRAGFEAITISTSARLGAMVVRESVRPEFASASPDVLRTRSAGLAPALFQLFERGLMLFDSNAGEELVLRAHKGPRRS
jgi:SAM-dependent methyltransferase